MLYTVNLITESKLFNWKAITGYYLFTGFWDANTTSAIVIDQLTHRHSKTNL